MTDVDAIAVEIGNLHKKSIISLIESGWGLVEAKALLDQNGFEKFAMRIGCGPRTAEILLTLGEYPALSKNKGDDPAKVFAGLSPEEREYVEEINSEFIEAYMRERRLASFLVSLDLSILPADYQVIVKTIFQRQFEDLYKEVEGMKEEILDVVEYHADGEALEHIEESIQDVLNSILDRIKVLKLGTELTS